VPESPRHLADTSAWIEALRPGASGDWPETLKSLITDRDLGIQPIIRVELLSGAVSESEYRRLNEALSALPRLDMTDEVWKTAEDLGYGMRRKGLTVPVTDLLIAATAIVHSCILHHRDRHFTLISRHSPLKARKI
jgi:hypothetical protein